MRVFILALMILSFAFSQEQSAKIGIDPDLLKQNYINVDENNKKRLDNALQNALFKLEYGKKDTKVFTNILTREERDKIIEEQNYQIDQGCLDLECAFEVGRTLGMDYMLIPTVISQDSDFVTVSLRLIDIQTGLVTSSSDEKTIPFCDVEYRNNLLDQMVSELYNNSVQPGRPIPKSYDKDGEEITKEEYLRGGLRETVRITTKKDDKGNETLKIKRSQKPAIKIKKLKPPDCAKPAKKSNNLLLMIGGVLLLVLLAAAGGGGDGGAPTGGVDIGITVP